MINNYFVLIIQLRLYQIIALKAYLHAFSRLPDFEHADTSPYYGENELAVTNLMKEMF
jgi:hypothetical protein